MASPANQVLKPVVSWVIADAGAEPKAKVAKVVRAAVFSAELTKTSAESANTSVIDRPSAVIVKVSVSAFISSLDVAERLVTLVIPAPVKNA